MSGSRASPVARLAFDNVCPIQHADYLLNLPQSLDAVPMHLDGIPGPMAVYPLRYSAEGSAVDLI
jgi:hypothetical protein